MGFKPIGVYRDVGHKLGRWHEVGWWQLPLGEDDGLPRPPARIQSVTGSDSWNAAMDSGLSLLRILCKKT